jgi:transcriptional regulator with XRE-family HTH domain
VIYFRQFMSRLILAKRQTAEGNNSFGEMIRHLRSQSEVPLRVVAAAIEIDTTLLSKLERGKRYPTEDQIRKFSKYFKIPVDELTAHVIADKFVFQYGKHPAAGDAIEYVKERITSYSERKS